MFHLGDAHYHLPRQNVQLVASTRINLTLPSAPAQPSPVRDLVLSGLWITRGNGLCLRIHADFNAFAPSSTIASNLLNDTLCETLPLAKLWSQLSLTASPTHPDPSTREPFGAFERTFGLTHTDLPSPEPSPTKTRACSAINISFHHVRPPISVLRGSVDAIELTLVFKPLISPNLAFRPLSTRAISPHSPQEGLLFLPDLSLLSRESTIASRRYSGRLRSKAKKFCEDAHFHSPEYGTITGDILLLGYRREDLGEPDMEPSPTTEPRQSLRHQSRRPSVTPQLKAKQTSITSLEILDPSEFMRLVDLSLRHTLGGMIPCCKKLTTPNDDPDDLQLVKAVSNTSLAEVSPALFRPGYMKAIAQRAHLISRIASSISSSSSRSHKAHQSCSDPTAASSSPKLRPVKTSQLQTQLWHLLQKKEWPTEDLIPLEKVTIGTYHRNEQDFELNLEPDEHEGVPPRDLERGETDDEMMVDLGLDFIGLMDEDDDEDLFSIYERTPCSSQDTTSLDIMLDYDEDDEGLSSWYERTPCSSQDTMSLDTMLEYNEKSAYSSRDDTSTLEMLLESDEGEEMMLEEELSALPENCDAELRARGSPPADQIMDVMETGEEVACIEDIEFELLEYDCEDGEHKVSM
ncbi:MAG: hypothetical protein Q9169_000350 [Polycauliona sp. 2 TL-2023]